MSHSESHSGEVLELAEEFLARYRQGERPPLCDYIDRHPHLADQIREVFPAMALMENIAIDGSAATVTGDQESRVEPAQQQLGDYRIIREVGRGGMGIVYEAEQVSLGRHVALKVLPRQMLFDGKQKRRFEREAKAAARLHHTNIVPVFGVGEHEGMHYYVMQFIQGLGLDQVLTELRKMHGDNRATAVMPMASQKPVSPSRGETAAAEMARSLMTGGFERTVLGPDEPVPTADVPDGAAQIDPANPGREAGGFSAGPSQKDSRSSANSSGARAGTSSDASSGSFSGSITLPGQSTAQSTTRIKKSTYWQSVAQIGTQVASALQYAHDQGILHRDIKPSNLLLDLRGTVWIADFGLAKANDQQEITHTGDILGTLRYMPPEAFEGKGDPRSDLYSLGLTLYELLALKPAFDDKDRNRLIQRVTTAEAPRLETLNPAIPRDLATIVHKAIERDPGHRYNSAGALADDLQRFVDDEPIVARPLSHVERLVRWSRRNRSLAAATTAIATLLLLITAGSVFAAAYLRSLNGDLRRNIYVADMHLARHAVDEMNVIQAMELLEKHRPNSDRIDQRAFEWHYLARKCAGNAIVIPVNEWISNISFTPDGRKILSMSIDQSPRQGRYGLDVSHATVRLRAWNISQGAVKEEPVTIDAAGIGMANHSGTHGVKTLSDHSCAIVDLATGEARPLESAKYFGNGFRRFSPNDDYVVITTWLPDEPPERLSDKLEVWETLSGRRRMKVDGLAKISAPPSFAPDGRGFAVSFRSTPCVGYWSFENDGDSCAFEAVTPVNGTAFSPDGKWLAGCGEGLTIWDVATRKVAAHHPLASKTGLRLAYSPDGRHIAVGSLDGVVEVLDASTGATLVTYRGHIGPVVALEYSPDGAVIATAGGDGTIRLWPTTVQNESFIALPNAALLDFFAPPQGVLSPDGRFALTGLSSATLPSDLTVWNLVTRRRATVSLENSIVPRATWTGDGQSLFLVDSTGRLSIVDSETGAVVREERTSRGANPVIAVSGDGTRLASSEADGRVSIRDLKTGASIAELPEPLTAAVIGLSLDHTGSRLVVFKRGGQLDAWSLVAPARAQKLASFDVGDLYVLSVEYSPDGRRIAVLGFLSRSFAGEARIFDLLSRAPAVSLKGHASSFSAGAFSSDGTRFASGGWDKSIRLWDPETGQELLLLKGHDRGIIDVRFRADDKQLISVDGDYVVRTWDATPLSQ